VEAGEVACVERRSGDERLHHPRSSAELGFDRGGERTRQLDAAAARLVAPLETSASRPSPAISVSRHHRANRHSMTAAQSG
jgi:hypothetical protein